LSEHISQNYCFTSVTFSQMPVTRVSTVVCYGNQDLLDANACAKLFNHKLQLLHKV